MGFFREMMFEHLSELSRARLLDNLENPAKLKGRPDENRHPLRQAERSSSMRMVLALLVQYPHLANKVEQTEAIIEEIDFAGADLLQDILRVIVSEKPKSSGALLEIYRESPHYKAIIALSKIEFGPGFDPEAEFSGSLNVLLMRAKKNRENREIDEVIKRQMLKTGGKT
jgi:DNA primase